MPRRIARRPFLALLASAFAAAAAPSVLRGATPGAVRTPPLAPVRLGDQDFFEARAFFGRYGLKPEIVEAGKRVRFESPWTKIELEVERREALFNGMRVFLGAPAALHRRTLHLSRIDAERLFAPILRPAAFAEGAPALRTVVLDAGHGGRDTGTQNPRFKLDEKNLTLDVTRRLQGLLEREGYKVVLTRNEDVFVDLEERAAIANRARADLFVSIHFNAVANAPAVRGTETYIMTPRHHASTQPERDKTMIPTLYPGNRYDPWNAVLGFHLHRKLMDKLGVFDRGLKRARFKVLTLVECPGVLLESAYLSNDGEADKVRTVAYRDQLAEAVAEGIRAYGIQLEGARKG